jgi:hypothetical protein
MAADSPKLKCGIAPKPAVVRSEVLRNFLREKYDLLMVLDIEIIYGFLDLGDINY